MITESPSNAAEWLLPPLLAAFVLAGCEVETAPAVERELATPDGTAEARYDPDEAVPPSLSGFRPSPMHDRELYLHGDRWPWLYDNKPVARTREDFRSGARKCLSYLVTGNWGWRYLTMDVFESKEEQAWWYGRMRAKEAVYGAGAEEAGCEREFLRMALLVARGDWQGVIESARWRDEMLEVMAEAKEWLEAHGKTWEDEEHYRFVPGDAETVARLEEWLEVR